MLYRITQNFTKRDLYETISLLRNHLNCECGLEIARLFSNWIDTHSVNSNNIHVVTKNRNRINNLNLI